MAHSLARLPILAVLAACAGAPASPDDSRTWRTNTNVLVGGRTLDDDDWSPIEDHGVVGLEIDSRPPSLPIGIEGGIMGSYGEDEVGNIGVEAAIGEAYVGARVTLMRERAGFHPYAGAGVTFLHGELDAVSNFARVSDDDSSMGGYAHAGLYWQSVGGFNLGIDARGVFGTDVDLFGVSGDADYFQVAFVIGGGF